MPTTFTKTLRSLDSERSRAPLVIAIASLLTLGAWVVWLVGAEVPVHEVSQAARLEVDQEAHLVDAPIDGRVASARLVLGSEVRRGELLVELDASEELLRVAEDRARVAALTGELEPLGREIAAEERALRDERLTGAAALDEALALAEEAQEASALSADTARRTEILRAGGSAAEAELTRVVAEQRRSEALATARRRSVRRAELEARSREQSHRARLERLHAERERLAGAIEAAEGGIRVREHRIALHRLEAPISGRLTQARSLQVGSFLEAGDRIALVVPHGELRIVAQFTPAALGRVRAGQSAWLRLDGFSWAVYGAIPARVSAVASDAPAGAVRVELAPLRTEAFPVELDHGLPGVVEVEVERVSPATLVLRAVGRMLTAGPASSRDAVVAGELR